MTAPDTRAALLRLLETHKAADEKERADLERMRDYAGSLGAPFSREEPRAHFTGSAVVVDTKGERVCLVHHLKLGRWLQPGGHAEPGDGGDITATALREAREETGLEVSLHPRAPRPLDVDIHVIPARKTEPEHAHLDIRFLVVGASDALSHDPLESHGAAWLSWDDALARSNEPAFLRLLEKARRHAAG